MATVHNTAFLAIIVIVLQSSYLVTSAPENGGQIFDICEEAGVCGRGRCVHVSNNTVGFACECEPGWQQQVPPQVDVLLQFLPCVIPNCTLNYGCTEARPRDYDNQRRTNYSDPCYVADCGGGRCRQTSPFTRTCECEEGYYNLLNSTVFPCYRRCAFGDDCPTLGYNSSTSIVDPNPFSFRFNHAASLMKRAEIACFVTMATTFVRAIWKYI